MKTAAADPDGATAAFDFVAPPGFDLPQSMAVLPYGSPQIAASTDATSQLASVTTQPPGTPLPTIQPVSQPPVPSVHDATVPQKVADAIADTGNAIVAKAVATTSTVVDAITPSSYAGSGLRGEVDELIQKYAAVYEVPVDLVRSVVKRESNFNPAATNHGHWGLMQIKHATARGMGYTGDARGLLDAETNLKYSVKYLRGAFVVANGDPRRADRLYQTGYYYDAKRRGLLDETGLGSDRVRHRARSPI